MNLTPEEFLAATKAGKSELELNKKEGREGKIFVAPHDVQKLIRNGHDYKSAVEHLETDYSNGFTICKCCGSFYQLGDGFTKHLSNGCLHCEGKAKHNVYHVNASKPSEGGFPARDMSQMFDDGMHYCKDKLQIEKYKELVNELQETV